MAGSICIERGRARRSLRRRAVLTVGSAAASPPARGGAGQATLIGAIAIVLWSTLALLATGAGGVPPFQLVAMSFATAAALALAKWLIRGDAVIVQLRQPPAAWLVGVGGLFLYHFLYFLALRHAPAVEVSLICYLWPLLIVVFAGLLPGERLRWWHLAGALVGLLGTALLITGGGQVAFRSDYALGYGAALGCAVTWAGYSALSRRFARVPTDAVGGFCAATAALALLCHFMWETTVWPRDTEWLAVIGLGIGPVGIAFFAWDYGVKHGNLKTLGGLSYATPLLSTILLVAFGRAAASASIAAAALLIVGGAVLAARDLWSKQA
jgi:drug/metabolite transporter (DMT)-like permease